MIKGMGTTWHIDVGCYAADTLDREERAAFEAHLVDCDDCRREVIEFAETSAELTRLVTAVPPQSVRGSVVAAIRTVRPLPPLTGPEPEHPPRQRPRASTTSRRSDRSLAYALVIVLLVATALVLAGWILLRLSEPVPELAPDTQAILTELRR